MRSPDATARTEPGRALDDYLEDQVHGTLDLARDVEELVVEPSSAGTLTGAALESSAQRHGFPLRWPPGFALVVGRGPVAETRQHLKQLRHVPDRYGEPHDNLTHRADADAYSR
ncbi:DUF3626 domain-containing protein [Micromonospora sp. WMMD961]|uniref:DUF3626 domain-containing protein n=1 Tax=Micromonospora sp. WMMD961 TaxID=3016100 RepID=UPI002415D315|nr:DUF3626 domain-containing protein [Micromonospora sp. WMMD961]MDG4781112.1 DUF3626 domain-containing protein [Micromonospora sp. WMMD961]